jgi:hypothetical protein
MNLLKTNLNLEHNDSEYINVIKEFIESDHSEEMEEIISAPPSWLLKWGILGFFCVLLIMLGITVVIHYPEMVKTTMALNAEHPPVPVDASQTGKLIHIFVQNDQIVTKNQPLAVIEIDGEDHPDKVSKETIFASANGEVLFSGILMSGQLVKSNERLFYIDQPNAGFYGKLLIPQTNLAKIKIGQIVLIKLKSYPFQDYGMLKGEIEFISEMPDPSNSFVAKVKINTKDRPGPLKLVKLKPGMLADAEIVTQDVSLFRRLTKNLFKMFQ